MNSNQTRNDAEQYATQLSKLDSDVWLVVDCGFSHPDFRVWREATLNEQLNNYPDIVPHFEILARASAGELLQTA